MFVVVINRQRRQQNYLQFVSFLYIHYFNFHFVRAQQLSGLYGIIHKTHVHIQRFFKV